MKLKKLTALLLALAMAFALVACGGGGNKPAAPDAADADPTALSASDPLIVWAWDDKFNVPAMQDAIDMYVAQNGLEAGCIKIDYMSGDDVETALTTAATSGDYSQLPDITLLQDHDYQKYLLSYPDLFASMADSGIDFSQFAQYKTNYSTVEGVNYAVPLDSGCVIAAYRTDVLADAGYTIEDMTGITWQRFIEIGADVYAKTGKHLMSDNADGFDPLLYMIQSAGGSMFNDDGSINLTTDNKPLVEAMQIYADMMNSGAAEMVSSWDEYIASFASKETTAGVINGAWILSSIQGGNDSMEGKWEMTTMPTLSTVDSATCYSNNGGSSWGVLASSSKAATAIDFLANTFASKDNATELYDKVLHSANLIGTFAPGLEADIYSGTLSKFGDQEIYAMIAEWAPQVPTSADSMYYYEARGVLGTAESKLIDGADIETVLAEAMNNYATQVG